MHPFFHTIAALPGEQLLDTTVQSDDHVLFWETFRSYVTGGDNPGAELLSTSLVPVVSMISTVAYFMVAATIIYNSAQRGQGVDMVIKRHMPKLLALGIAFFFLANNYVKAYEFVDGIWQVRQSIRSQLLFSRSNAYTMANALNNEIFYQKFGARVKAEFSFCNQMPRPAVAIQTLERPPANAEPPPSKEESQVYDYLECIDLASTSVRSRQLALQRECSVDGGQECIIATRKAQELSRKINERVKDNEKFYTSLDRDLEEVREGRDLDEIPDLDFGFITFDGDEPFLKAVRAGNWYFLSYLELAWSMAGAFFPGVIAVSIIPGLFKVLADWFTGALSLVVAENIYLAILGVTAIVSQDEKLADFGSQVFLQFLGAGAPWAALAGFLFSGFAISRQYRGSGTAIGMAVVGSVPYVGASVAHAASSRRYLRR